MRNINLLPLDYRPQPKFQVKSFIRLLIGGIGLASLVFFLLITQLRINNTARLISTKSNNIELLEAQLREMGTEADELDSIDAIMREIEEIQAKTTSYKEVMDDIVGFTPRDMEISSLNIEAESIAIQGQSTSLNTISNFLQSLDQWELGEKTVISNISPTGDQVFFNIQVKRWRSEQ